MKLNLKTVLDLADDFELVTNRKVTWYTHVKYEGRNSYQLKDTANVKGFSYKQTNGKSDNVHRLRGCIKPPFARVWANFSPGNPDL